MIAITRFAAFAIIVAFNASACGGFSLSSARTVAALPQRSRHEQRRRRCDGRVDGILIAQEHDQRFASSTSSSPSSLPMMGIFDFFSKREGDFVPLEESDGDAPFGPGPLILMYAVPETIDDGELMDMVDDGMPGRNGVVMRRLAGMDASGGGGDAMLDMRVGEALEAAMNTTDALKSPEAERAPIKQSTIAVGNTPCPVLYFSGVTNGEMMSTYQIIANEIYEETNGVHWPACAKYVPPATDKSLRRVLGEISGDHEEAMMMRREEMAKLREEGLPGVENPPL